MAEQIIALGGGGFSMEPDNPLLDQYILQASGKLRPRVCFLSQASGEAAEYIINFYRAFGRLECPSSHLSLFTTPPVDIAAHLLAQDVIYVGGGNTKSLLALWQAWELPAILRRALAQGTVLCGISAGAICWFDDCVTDSVAPELGILPCLGFLPGSFCPHYDGEAQRRPVYQQLVAGGEIQPGFAADDGCAFHFVDGTLHAVVTSRPGAGGYRLERVNGAAQEERLPVRYLG